jgi:hypothetical protein
MRLPVAFAKIGVVVFSAVLVSVPAAGLSQLPTLPRGLPTPGEQGNKKGERKRDPSNLIILSDKEEQAATKDSSLVKTKESSPAKKEPSEKNDSGQRGHWVPCTCVNGRVKCNLCVDDGKYPYRAHSDCQTCRFGWVPCGECHGYRLGVWKPFPGIARPGGGKPAAVVHLRASVLVDDTAFDEDFDIENGPIYDANSNVLSWVLATKKGKHYSDSELLRFLRDNDRFGRWRIKLHRADGDELAAAFRFFGDGGQPLWLEFSRRGGRATVLVKASLRGSNNLDSATRIVVYRQ